MFYFSDLNEPIFECFQNLKYHEENVNVDSMLEPDMEFFTFDMKVHGADLIDENVEVFHCFEQVCYADVVPNSSNMCCKILLHDEDKRHGLCDDYFRPQIKFFQVDASLNEKDLAKDFLQPEVCILFHEWDI